MTDLTASTHDPLGDTSAGASMIRREEELRVGTERVVRGRVTVRKRIVEEQQTLTVTVRREEIEVVEEPVQEQPSVESPVPGSRLDSADGEQVLVLYAERPVVTMERVPVERVVVRKVVTSEDQVVTAQVAKEVVTLSGVDADARLND